MFQAIHAHDADALARLLARNPSLATATEDWSPPEGFDARLGFSERATALIRAAGIGDLRLVRLLVEAGAPVADPCPCAGHESALLTAVNIGATEVVDYLLDHGAPVEGGAFDGESTPLHVAVYRERHDLVRRLLAAGADPATTDAHGRTAADWGALKAARRPEAHDGDVLWARIRAIDFFAPLPRGALVHVPPAYGLGAMRALFGMVDALAPAHWWMIGFEHGPYEPVELKRDARQRTAATIDLVGPGHPADRRRQFAEASSGWPPPPVARSSRACPHRGTSMTHRRTSGPRGRPVGARDGRPRPIHAGPAPVPQALPEGFDARITFDPARAAATGPPRPGPHQRADLPGRAPRAHRSRRPRRTHRLRRHRPRVRAARPVHVRRPGCGRAGARPSCAICATRSARSSCSPHCRPPTPRWPRSSTPSRTYSASDEVQSFSRSKGAGHWGNGVVVLDTVSPGVPRELR